MDAQNVGHVDYYRESCPTSALRSAVSCADRSPAAVAIATLSLGLASVTPLFAVTDAVILQPIGDGDSRLVRIRVVRRRAARSRHAGNGLRRAGSTAASRRSARARRSSFPPTPGTLSSVPAPSRWSSCSPSPATGWIRSSTTSMLESFRPRMSVEGALPARGLLLALGNRGGCARRGEKGIIWAWKRERWRCSR